MKALSAQELRIGNLVNMGEYLYQPLNAYNIYQLSLLEKGGTVADFYHKIAPIELTEDWLIRFGFEVFEFDHKENQYSFKDRLIVIRDGYFCDYGTSVIIKHVHQLQNLYFALTGTELEIKPQLFSC